MANLISSTVGSTTFGANYAKAAPGSKFGTRELEFYSVTITGVHTNYANSDSTFAKAVRGIQQVAEIYFVGTPSSDAFVVAIAGDTNNGQSSANANDESLEVAIERALAVSPGSATVAALTASGASIA